MSRPTQVSGEMYIPPAADDELAVTSADGSARLHTELHGPEGAPAVVLAHGWTCSTAFWAPVIRALSPDHRLIAYDQRGHGRSPAVPGSYNTGTLADDLCAVLDAALPDGERAVLVGHSMGAMTLVAAADRPQVRERGAAALLCSTGSSRLVEKARVLPVISWPLRALVQRALLVSSAPLGPVTPLSTWILRYGAMGAGPAPDQVDACVRIVHACPRLVRAEWARVLATLDLEADLQKLTAPTEVLVGTADRLTPMPHAHRMARSLPDCMGVTELAGIGHMAPIEAPEAITSVIRKLVTDHLRASGPARSAVSSDVGGAVPAARAGEGVEGGASAMAGEATQAPEAQQAGQTPAAQVAETGQAPQPSRFRRPGRS